MADLALLPDVSALLEQASRPPADVALRQSYTTPGRLTFVWDEGGDLVWDHRAAWPVLSTIICHKGRYRHDRNFGTLIHRVRKDRLATGTQLGEYARDGAAQVEAEGLAQDVRAAPRKLATGRWKVRLSWTSAGEVVDQELGL